MQIQFTKMIQFTRLLKAGGLVREFNFRKLTGPEERLFTVNVCDERGNRILFNMQKKDNDWKIVPDILPAWIIQSENGLHTLIEEELSGIGTPE